MFSLSLQDESLSCRRSKSRSISCNAFPDNVIAFPFSFPIVGTRTNLANESQRRKRSRSRLLRHRSCPNIGSRRCRVLSCYHAFSFCINILIIFRSITYAKAKKTLPQRPMQTTSATTQSILTLPSPYGATGKPMYAGTKIDREILSSIFPPIGETCRSTLHKNTGNQTHVHFTFTSSQETSQWHTMNANHEQNVFQAEMKHIPRDENTNHTWSMRFGKGGNIYSFIGPFGESVSLLDDDKERKSNGEIMPPQSVESAPWMDEVWQNVMVNMNRNNVSGDHESYFLHQAGTYKENNASKPFYSPNLATYCSEDEHVCMFASWVQQAHLPTRFRSNVILYSRYVDCGQDGVVEMTSVIHNMEPSKVELEREGGYDPGDDMVNWLNMPWAGVRTSTFRDLLVSNSLSSSNNTVDESKNKLVASKNDVDISSRSKSTLQRPLQSFGEGGTTSAPRQRDTGGYAIFTQGIHDPTIPPFQMPCSTTNDGEETPCPENGGLPLSANNVLVVAKNDPVRTSVHHSQVYGRTTMVMELQPTLVELVTGTPHHLRFVNVRTQREIRVMGVLHWSWMNHLLYFWPAEYHTVKEINRTFRKGDTMEIKSVAPDKSQPYPLPSNMTLIVARNNTAEYKAHHSRARGHYTLALEIVPTAEIRTGCGYLSRDCHFRLQNTRSSRDDITIEGIYHWSWYGKYFFFWPSLNYTADEINTVFAGGDEIVVYPTASSTSQEKQEVRKPLPCADRYGYETTTCLSATQDQLSLVISADNTCVEHPNQTFMRGQYTVSITIRPTIRIQTGCFRCALQLYNPRTSRSISINGVLHWSWDSIYFFVWPKPPITAQDINAAFREDDIMVVKYDEYGLDYNDNLALSLVYGVDNHQNVPYVGDGFVRFGKAYGIVRDYTVFTPITRVQINPGDSFINRQYIVSGRLAEMDDKSTLLVKDTLQEYRPAEIQFSGTSSQKIHLYSLDKFIFGVALEKDSTSVNNCYKKSTIRCVGSALPKPNHKRLFAIACNGSYYVGVDPYYFEPSPSEKKKNKKTPPTAAWRQPYICRNDPEQKPTYQLLGYFEEDSCSYLKRARLDPTFCSSDIATATSSLDLAAATVTTAAPVKELVVKHGRHHSTTSSANISSIIHHTTTAIMSSSPSVSKLCDPSEKCLDEHNDDDHVVDERQYIDFLHPKDQSLVVEYQDDDDNEFLFVDAGNDKKELKDHVNVKGNMNTKDSILRIGKTNHVIAMIRNGNHDDSSHSSNRKMSTKVWFVVIFGIGLIAVTEFVISAL